MFLAINGRNLSLHAEPHRRKVFLLNSYKAELFRHYHQMTAVKCLNKCEFQVPNYKRT
jgi:hypothetical protein